MLTMISCARFTPYKRALKDSDIIVERTSSSLPTDAADREKYFNDYMAALDESDLGRRWLADLGKVKHYEAVLIQKATLIGADAASLRRILDVIFKDGACNSYFACAAYETTLDNNPVWIVVLAWPDYGHFMVYAYDQKTLNRVGIGVYM